MSEFDPKQSSTPESFVDARDNALEWIKQLGYDFEIDMLVATPEGNTVWQKLMTKFVDSAPPESREDTLKQWRKINHPKINRDPRVREKNLLLASLANEVEEESSADGRYLRTLLTSFNESAKIADDEKAIRRIQFMGIWAVRQINTDLSF